MTARLTAAITAAKCYPPIGGVDGVDIAEYETTGPLHVAAFDGLVSIQHDEIGTLTLTTEQAFALEERLAQARADVDAAIDGEPPLLTEASGDGPACEVCCQPIAAGARVAIWVDGGRMVVAHADRCPFSEQTVMVRSDGGSLGRPINVHVRAQVAGLWALHSEIGTRMAAPQWTVTHVPSGLALVQGIPRREARRLVAALGERCSGPEFEALHEQGTSSPAIDAIRAVHAEVLRG